MKKTLLAALLVMVAASWCLAQTDSLPAPTAEDTMKANPVAVKTTECPDKKWIIGFEATSLDLKALPGTVFLQRKISPKFFVGAGFSYDYYNNKPGEDYNAEDSTRHNYESKQWSIAINPEIGFTALNRNNITGGLSIRLSLSRNHYTSSQVSRYERYYYSYNTSLSESNSFNYGIIVPVFIEKQFKIKKLPVAIGVVNNLIALSSGWDKQKYKSTYESYYSPTPDVNEHETTRKQPVMFSLDNPFQGYVRVFFKIFL